MGSARHLTSVRHRSAAELGELLVDGEITREQFDAELPAALEAESDEVLAVGVSPPRWATARWYLARSELVCGPALLPGGATLSHADRTVLARRFRARVRPRQGAAFWLERELRLGVGVLAADHRPVLLGSYRNLGNDHVTCIYSGRSLGALLAAANAQLAGARRLHLPSPVPAVNLDGWRRAWMRATA